MKSNDEKSDTIISKNIEINEDKIKAEDYIREFQLAYDRLFRLGELGVMRIIVNDMEEKLRGLKAAGMINKGSNDYEFLEEKLEDNKKISRKIHKSLEDIETFYTNYENYFDIYKGKTRSGKVNA